MWAAETTDEFDAWFVALDEGTKIVVATDVHVLRTIGPTLGRPHVDALNGSKHANMKELRVQADRQVIRVAFAFDPRRTAMLLVAGDKSGMSQRVFYRQLIARADALYDAHLQQLKNERNP